MRERELTLSDFVCMNGFYRPGYVYFILQPSSALVKIGRTRSLRTRLRTLQYENGGALEVLVCLSVFDHYACERWLHRCFAHLCDHGEWFHRDEYLDYFVEALIRGDYFLDNRHVEQDDSVQLSTEPQTAKLVNQFGIKQRRYYTEPHGPKWGRSWVRDRQTGELLKPTEDRNG